MITLPTTQELKELQTYTSANCLTLYIPYTEPINKMSHGLILFKNQMKQAKVLLLSNKVESKIIDQMMEPAYKMAEDSLFWQDVHEEVVFFIAPKFFRYFHIPASNSSQPIKLADSFYVEPIEKINTNNVDFMLLTISHNTANLYRGDKYYLSLVTEKVIPDNMEKALRIDELPHSRQLHPIGPVGTGNDSAGYHEQYDVSKVDKNMLLEYFRLVDAAINTYLNTSKLPLVIGGVQYLLPIYREANTYPKLIADTLHGNLEKMGIAELHKKVLALQFKS